MRTITFCNIIIATMLFAACTSSHKHDDAAEADNHNHAEENIHADEKENHADEIILTDAQTKAIGLKTEQVKPAAFRAVLKTSGQIQVSQGSEQTVVATTAGIVTLSPSSVTEGMFVHSGERIATISAKKIQDGDAIHKAKIAYDIASKEYKRAKDLVSDKIISQKDYEQIRLRYETAKVSYTGLVPNITSAGVGVSSPMSGYIKQRFVGNGEYVSVGQPIVVVTQNKRLQLRAEVTESNYKHLQSISGANFKTSYDDQLYQLSKLNGRLVSYSRASSSDNYYIPVTFEFDNVGNVVPGSYAEIYLLLNKREAVISVPVAALTEEQDHYFVYLQIAHGIYKKQEVQIGQSDGGRVEIFGGLKSGDNVVIQGAVQVKMAASVSSIPDAHNH